MPAMFVPFPSTITTPFFLPPHLFASSPQLISSHQTSHDAAVSQFVTRNYTADCNSYQFGLVRGMLDEFHCALCINKDAATP